MKIVDGNKACSDIAYLFSEVCSIYPITPASPMAENVDDLISKNNKNILGSVPRIIEMQSEAGAAGAMHGSLLTGALSTTFTASQGLILMIPNMYKIAGELLPGVIHVASRSLATQSLSIFGDHQDIYATRSTGFCILASTNVYDAQNLAAVAHLSAIEGSLPFVHFFDGFRTSHELNTIKELRKEDLKELVNYEKINEFRSRVLHVGSNKQYGMAENEDIYFQNMEARNTEYLKMPDIVNDYMSKINKIMGTEYAPFNYYGSRDAENIIIAMGSVCDTIKIVIEKLNSIGKKIGLVEVHLYRPFSSKYLLKVLPDTVKNIAVLDRTKEPGSAGEPLYLDVVTELKSKNINICGGRYGLSSKNVTPEDIMAVYQMLEVDFKDEFTIGIEDDVTYLSLRPVPIDISNNDKEIKIYGFGSDGMVSASKDLLKTINKETNQFVQGYFEYDSKKSGGVTISHLRLSSNPINKPFYVNNPIVTVVTKIEYLSKYSIIKDIPNNSVLLLNTSKSDEEISLLIPDVHKNISIKKIDADKIAELNNLGNKISKIMELAILEIMGFSNIKDHLIESIKSRFITKGEEVVNNNINALNHVHDSIKDVILTEQPTCERPDNKNIYALIDERKGYSLKVSDVLEIKDGSFENNLTRYEKRNISLNVPYWNKDNCIECGQCSLVCPHAVIRTVLTKNKEKGIPLLENNEYNYVVNISKEDCTGCGLCASVCPGKMGNKALEMKKKDNTRSEMVKGEVIPNIINKYTIKGSQLEKPLFEFSGACAGCGETPYIKLLTQIVGKKLVIANATGCSSIYGGSAPSTPYLVPWANSLFEDNAEFALGMKLSLDSKRKRIEEIIKDDYDKQNDIVKTLYDKWLNNQNDYNITSEVKDELMTNNIPSGLKELINYIPSNSVWAIGGDGWAYDIGYGGLDHVLHSNQNINILVLDTEVYSNTGGQSSKSTNMGAVASFAELGKKTPKKDLFRMAMAIPNCYVASISLGANMFQAIKAFKEAEEHNGPSIIIAYSPCVEQGIKKGMSCSILEEKLAVLCGYSLLMRYNPIEKKLYLDSKDPDFEKYMEFLDNEVRFNALKIKDKNLADKLLNNQKELAKQRFEYYKKIAL